MNIQEEWANLNQEVIIKSDSELAEFGRTIKRESGNLLDKLQKNVEIKLAWARGIGLVALIIAVFSPAPLNYWLFAIFIVYQLGIFFSIREKNQLRYKADYGGVTRTVITQQLDIIKRILKIEEIWGYVFIPLAGPAGLFLHYLYNGKTLEEIITMPNMAYLLFGLLLLGIPGVYLAKIMNYYAIGKYVARLKENLKQFDE